MTSSQTGEPTSTTPLRLWPGVLVVLLQWLGGFVAPLVVPGFGPYGILAGLLGGLLVLVWWLFFSRAPWSERVGAIVVMVVAVLATSRVVHESIATGMMGMMLPIVAVPLLSLALVSWAMVSRGFPLSWRRLSMIAAIVAACGVLTLVRTGGLSGDARSDLHWRWTETPEERLLATEKTSVDMPRPAVSEPRVSAPQTVAESGGRVPSRVGNDPAVVPLASDEDTVADWPGFRGPLRDGVVRGVRIDTDWIASPPVTLWRHPIGPGWSSFAVHGHLLYTQEQRGDDELVSCYELRTGELVWRHRDAARFWESNAGAGPRGTPTLDHGRVYTFGATGILNALDARDGSLVWSRNAAHDTDTPIPGWGFSSSPLVIDDLVVVAASGRLAAYDVSTGRPRWFRQTSGGGYSSPHRATIAGVAQILLPNGGGVTAVAPEDGALLWDHRWIGAGTSIVQPALTADGDVLLGAVDATASGISTRRLHVTRPAGGWTVDERWTSNGLKPSFNDFVVHKGHVFGFDGGILSCIDLETGARTWKGGRYGHGQLVLLEDQDLLLVLSEEGELALVAAEPNQFRELAKFPAIEGKTWNHPALAGDVLLVRNGEEMAAFRLAVPRR